MSPRLSFAIQIAQEAGDSTLALFRAGREFELKDNATPVTEADLGAERILRARISERYPGESVLGEEYGGDSMGGTRWVVDPIDGTKSFVAGVPLYATLVAFEVGGEPVVGVAHFPALGETVYAEKGGGAFWNGKPCRVTANQDQSTAVYCCGGHASMSKSDRLKGFLELTKGAMAARTWCDAYGHALVATGRADAMIDPQVSRWDVSAMAVIVREAGGRFTDFQGRDVLTNEAVSCAPQALSAIVEAFRP